MKTDAGDMFPQDHRANGKLQPDHPGDYTSVGAPGQLEKLHGQPAEPLQLHQRGRHPAGEERPAAADDAAGLARITDHHHPLLQLVCAIQGLKDLNCLIAIGFFTLPCIVQSNTQKTQTKSKQANRNTPNTTRPQQKPKC